VPVVGLDGLVGGVALEAVLAQRPAVASLASESEPARLIAGFAGVTTAINERTNDVYRVLVGAAGADEDAAALLASIGEQRDRGQRSLTRAPARTGRSGAVCASAMRPTSRTR
jgi:hypothetical protein